MSDIVIVVIVYALAPIGWTAHQVKAAGRKAVHGIGCAVQRVEGKRCKPQEPLPPFKLPVD